MTPRRGGTSIVAPEDPFLAWYRSQPEQPVEDPNEIQMPAVDARAPAPTIGFPHDPGPILDQDAAFGSGARANPEMPMPAEQRRPLVPRHCSRASVSRRQRSTARCSSYRHRSTRSAAATGRPTCPLAPGGNEAAPPTPHGVELTPEQRAQMFAASSPEDQARQMFAWQDARDAPSASARPRRARGPAAPGREPRAVAARAGRGDARAKQLDADAHAEAQREIDPKWKAGTGKRIAGIIMGIVGGLVQSRSGGPNLGLQLIDQEIERDIEAQKANKAARLQELARRGASNQQLMAFAGDQYAEDEKTRLSTYTRVQNQIASEMQQFDPKGKTAIQLGQMYTQIGQARAKALVDFQDKDFKNRVDALKAASALRKEAAETEKLQLESAKLRGALAAPARARRLRSIRRRRSCSPTTSSRSGCRGRRGRCRATPTRTGSSCERKRTRRRPAKRRCRRRSSSTASAI
jgi:hypothetical protein